MFRSAIAIALLLAVCGTALADLPEGLLGDWTVTRMGVTMVFTFNADGTYAIQIAFSGELWPQDQGTYEVSGTQITFHPEGDGEPFTIRDVTVSGDNLSFYDPEEGVTVTGERGIHFPGLVGTGRISGTIFYEGTVEAGISVGALVPSGEGGDPSIGGLVVIPQPGPYTIERLPAGAYIVYAVLGPLSGEPEVWGHYAIGQEIVLVEVAEGAHVEGIDITLHGASAVRALSWGTAKTAF